MRMRPVPICVTILALSLPMGLAGWQSATAQSSLTNEPATSRPITAKTMARQVEHLIGGKVEDAEGKEIGALGNLLVDPGGKVAGIVVNCKAEAADCNQTKKLSLPWSDVRLSPDGRKMALTTTAAQLATRPPYDPLSPGDGVDPDALPFPSR